MSTKGRAGGPYQVDQRGVGCILGVSGPEVSSLEPTSNCIAGVFLTTQHQQYNKALPLLGQSSADQLNPKLVPQRPVQSLTNDNLRF